MNGGIDNANEEEGVVDRREKGRRFFFVISFCPFFKKKAATQTVNNCSTFCSLGFHNF